MNDLVLSVQKPKTPVVTREVNKQIVKTSRGRKEERDSKKEVENSK